MERTSLGWATVAGSGVHVGGSGTAETWKFCSMWMRWNHMAVQRRPTPMGDLELRCRECWLLKRYTPWYLPFSPAVCHPPLTGRMHSLGVNCTNSISNFVLSHNHHNQYFNLHLNSLFSYTPPRPSCCVLTYFCRRVAAQGVSVRGPQRPLRPRVLTVGGP